MTSTFLRFWWLWSLCMLLLTALQAADEFCGHFLNDAWDLCVWICILLLGLLQIATLVVSIVTKQTCNLPWILTGGVLSGLTLAAVIGIILFFATVEIMFGAEEDPFGREHPIPDTLQCELPLVDRDVRYYYDDDTVGVFKKAVIPVIDSTDATSLLQIHEGFEPGIYDYDFYYFALPDGVVFLKCFEVTENVELFSSRLRQRSEVPVSGHNAFGPVVQRQEFTIYEGSWGEPYAVRVEVWFKENGISRVRMLVSKTYKMEGWMR